MATWEEWGLLSKALRKDRFERAHLAPLSDRHWWFTTLRQLSFEKEQLSAFKPVAFQPTIPEGDRWSAPTAIRLHFSFA